MAIPTDPPNGIDDVLDFGQMKKLVKMYGGADKIPAHTCPSPMEFSQERIIETPEEMWGPAGPVVDGPVSVGCERCDSVMLVENAIIQEGAAVRAIMEHLSDMSKDDALALLADCAGRVERDEKHGPSISTMNDDLSVGIFGR